MGYLQERFGATLLKPLAPNLCPMCGREHEEGWPHDRDKLYYQYKFYDEHGYWPSWADAMAHCSDAVKAYWKEQLEARGISLDERPDTVRMSLEVKADRNSPPTAIVTVTKKEDQS